MTLHNRERKRESTQAGGLYAAVGRHSALWEEVQPNALVEQLHHVLQVLCGSVNAEMQDNEKEETKSTGRGID
jgi:hypothetical protein